MITRELIKKKADKLQTRESNIVREYVQHLFLLYFYQEKLSKNILFKGGTALRFIYQSPRFSEDLDFTGRNIYSYRLIEDVFIETINQLEKFGFSIELKEAKSTTGGYLGIIAYQIYEFVEQLKFEISLRRGKKVSAEVSSIIGEYSPPYSIMHLSGVQIVRGKIAALVNRQKPRDYYDLYFILRHPELHKYITKNNLQQINQLLFQTKMNLKKELSVLLPQNHQIILKDFKVTLSREIKKYL